ncbi:protein TonB [Silvimonas terrae]|uniref:Protein TonB n=1 Tax=Silvimonas terrae TaxID=300266 RepID=A0A840RK44_9NEIS|nr:TonB family protein [Silvimonas terrae]MBB5193675.1 protein TonB [Silvimonas terrae]
MSSTVMQSPLLRSMGMALLLEGLLATTGVLLLSHQLLKAPAPAPAPQMVSLVAPEAAPTPAPPKPPAPMPRPVMHDEPHPAPAPHVQAAPPAPATPPSPLDTAAQSPTPPAPPPPPAPAPAVAGPSPVDVFAAQLRGAVQSAVLYPYALKQMGETGQATVEFDYLDGTLSNIHIAKSSTISAFDHAALAAVQAAPLPAEPAALVGHKHTYRVNVQFRLD